MSQINVQHDDVLKDDAKVEENRGTEGDEADDKGNRDEVGEDSGRIRGTTWLNAISAVSDLTKYNWRQVFEMSALEFFTFLSYYNYRVKKQEAEIKKLQKRKH